MQRIAVFLAAICALAVPAGPAVAQEFAQGAGNFRTVEVESWIEEWDPVRGRWVKVAEGDSAASAASLSIPTVTTTLRNGEVIAETRSQARDAARFARPSMAPQAGAMVAQYGPFVVTGANVARMVGPTDSMSPQHFAAMLRDFPQLDTLEMVEAPGTSNDLANLEVGRMIRAAGLATHVPRGGSVRSGAVELFLAGATRTLEDGAQFAVHSWLDNYGREADDFAADHPAHRLYLDYYVEMGMSESHARAFYDMTNSVPHSGALWLRSEDMRPWIAPEPSTDRVASREIEAQLAEAGSLWDAVTVEADEGFAAPQPVLTYHDVNEVLVARLDLSRLDSLAAFP